MKLIYLIMTEEEIIGKVYLHPTLGRTICFEGQVKMDDVVKIYEILEDGKYEKVAERLVLEMFRDMLPIQ